MGLLSSLSWPLPSQPILRLNLPGMELMATHMLELMDTLDLSELELTDMVLLEPSLPQLWQLPQPHTSTHTIMPVKYTQLPNLTSTSRSLLNHTSMKKSLPNHMYTPKSPPSHTYTLSQ